MRALLYIWLLLCCSYGSYGQHHQGANSSGSFGPFVDVPVSHYTGVAHVGIPLATVAEGPLQVSLGLQYHGAGVHNGALASEVGLNWSLSGVGAIYRNVRGILDEDIRDGRKGYYVHGGTLNLTNTHQTEIENGDRDGEADIFSFYLPGYSGKFFFAGGDGINPSEVVLVPRQNLEVEVTDVECSGGTNSFCYIRGFVITTPEGTRYYFGKYDNNAFFSVERTTNSNLPLGSPLRDYATSWYLARIETHDGKHDIEYVYRTSNYKYKTLAPSDVKVVYNGSSTSYTYIDAPDVSTLAGTQIKYYTLEVYAKVLDSIKTRTQVIDFDHISRSDVDIFGTNNRWALSGLNVHMGSHCYSYAFKQTYFGDGTGMTDPYRIRLKLDEVQKVSCTGSVAEPPYVFTYNSTNNLGHRLSKAIDHYGFQNGATNNNQGKSLVHFSSYSNYTGTVNFIYGDADRSVDTIVAKRGLLTRVEYPTGGHTDFVYEANRAYDKNAPNSTTPIGGFEAGQSGPGEPCDTPLYVKTESYTLTQADIDNGEFDYGIRAHYGDCNQGISTDVLLEIRQNGSLKFSQGTNGSQYTSIHGVLDNIGLVPGTIEVTLEVTYEGRGFVDLYTSTANTDVAIGGFRIRQVKHHDGFDSNKDIIRNYRYRKSFTDNASSGVYVGRPLYGHLISAIGGTYTLMAEPFSLAPISSFEGYHVGYTRVEEDQNGNGTVVHTFRAESFDHIPQYPAVGLTARVLSGSADTAATYQEDGTLLAYEESTELYENYENPGHFNIRVKTISGIPPDMTKTTYYNATRNPMRPESAVMYQDGVTKNMAYAYSSNALQLQPNEITYTNGDGSEVKTRIKYLGHYEQGLVLLNYFRNQNLIGIPYQTESIIDGVTVDGQRSEWSFFNSTGAPTTTSSGNVPYVHQQRRYERTWDAGGTITTGAWRTLGTTLKYNMTFGLPAETQEANWATRYLKYDDVGNLKVDSFINYKQAWEYFANSGILKSTTAVDGQKTSYTYDLLTRPWTITDECSGTVVTKTYGFQDGTNSGYNWVKEHTNYVLVGGSAVDVIEDISYLDGLGRPVQTVAKNQSQTSNRDIVLAVSYDNQGRIAKTFNPYHSTGTAGKYTTVASTYEHTLRQYEPSPLHRIWKITAPGWYPVEYQYGTNGSSMHGHAASTLYKQTVIDGNGNKRIGYKDQKGRTILSRSTNNTETIQNDVVYEYDDKDRPIKVLPPSATSAHANLIYTKVYDERDNVVWQKVSGKAAIEHTYNNRGLLAYTQDGYLSGQGQWYAYQYDSYGRETQSGLHNNLPGSNLQFSQATITEALTENLYGASGTHQVDKLVTAKNKVLGTSSWLETSSTYDACGRVTNTAGNSYVNLANSSAETHTFTYDWMDNLRTDTYSHNAFGSTKNIVEEYTWDKVGRQQLYYHKIGTAAKVQLCDLDFNYEEELSRKTYGPFSSISMDYTYLANGLFSTVNAAGLSNGDLFYEELKYDASSPFSGSTAPIQKNGNIAVAISQVKGHERHAYGYQYDFLNRMLQASYIKQDGTSGSTLSSGDYNVTSTYDARGNINTLTRKGQVRDGSTFAVADIDQLVYDYPTHSNVLTSVTDNAPAASKMLGYQAGAGNYTYDANGNVLYDPSRGVTYTYNHLDVPVKADWGDGRTIDWVYDARGNMLEKLVKRGSTILEQRRYVGKIEYGGNQIETIYHDVGRLYNTSYDPARLDLDGIITGTQAAFGTEIQSTSLIETGSHVDYTAEDFIELNENFTVEAGSEFEAIIGSGPGGEDWRYDYSITDHLGNTRVIFSDLNSNGSITADEIIAEYQYYPFGLRKDGDWGENTYLNNENYQYNGIEYVEDHGLDMNMARYRMLDPGLARWSGVDPYAESFYGMSPYCSMGNSPTVYSDPEGGFIHIVIGAAIGGVINLGVQAYKGNIGSFGDGLAAFGIGAVAGGVGAATGGAALAASGLGGAAGGAIAGGAGGLTGGFINGTGNALYFQDANIGEALGQGLIEGAIGLGTGAILGAGIGALTTPKGYSPWTGKPIVSPTAGNTVTINVNGQAIEVPGYTAEFPNASTGQFGGGNVYTTTVANTATPKGLPNGVTAQWGKFFNYKHGGNMSAIEHIMYRHSYNAGFDDVSRFAQGTNAKIVKNYVDQAVRYGTETAKGTFQYNFNRVIGLDRFGFPATSIRVHVNNGWVKTAFPINN